MASNIGVQFDSLAQCKRCKQSTSTLSGTPKLQISFWVEVPACLCMYNTGETRENTEHTWKPAANINNADLSRPKLQGVLCGQRRVIWQRGKEAAGWHSEDMNVDIAFPLAQWVLRNKWHQEMLTAFFFFFFLFWLLLSLHFPFKFLLLYYFFLHLKSLNSPTAYIWKEERQQSCSLPNWWQNRTTSVLGANTVKRVILLSDTLKALFKALPRDALIKAKQRWEKLFQTASRERPANKHGPKLVLSYSVYN